MKTPTKVQKMPVGSGSDQSRACCRVLETTSESAVATRMPRDVAARPAAHDGVLPPP